MSVIPANSQVYLTESFEIGAKPDGWTEDFASGTEPWRFRNGGHSPNDNNWQVPPGQVDITRNPPSAFSGNYNAIFFKQGDDNERTKLVTPQMNLLGGANIELSFYLCQIPWTFEGSSGWDVLRVYYKVSETSPWILLHEYLDPVYEWSHQTLLLPNPSATYYVGFEGHTRWGYGTCIDMISIESKGSQPLWIKNIDFQQPFSNYVPSGSPDVPVMRVGFTVYGNTGTAILNNIQFTSLNTSNTDIKAAGIKLYSTTTQTFTKDHPLGTPADFISGVASFTNLNHSLPPGQSYLWLTYDLKLDIPYGNILDVKVSANNILANDTLYPAVEKSPVGYRIVYQTQYFENFEGTHNWNLTGEFEVNSPAGLGGSPGNPDPVAAFSGTKILGTDLTGLGPHPYNYEPDISEALSHLATSPSVNLQYYKNINLYFQRYLNIEVWDSSYIQISIDNGSTWNTIWNNQNSWISDFQWTQQRLVVPDEYSRTNQFMIRYKLGPTNSDGNYSGWNIDDFYLTAEFITRDAGVSEWIYPLSGSGHSANDSVKVRISNFGGATITDPIPVAYTFNGGQSWVVNNLDQDIPVGGSVIFTFPTKVDLSVPGLRSQVWAETRLPGDQFTNNDRLKTQIYIVPTYTTPFFENFETNEGFWRASGNPIWEYGTPAKTVINKASSGSKSWVTGLTRKYGDLINTKNRIIFEDDFEYDLGWSYSGEFERDVPDYSQLPYFAYSGFFCIGTDLSGTGATPFKYENGISTSSAYNAISPSFDVTNYSHLIVSYMGWVSVQSGDSVSFDVSTDNGATWHSLWKNTEGAIFEEYFTYREFIIPDSLSNSGSLRFRFSLFHSSASGPVAQGWSVEDFLLTGDLINTSEGILSSPSYDLTGLINPVFETRLWIDTESGTDGATLLYSLDDGATWSPVSNSSIYDGYWNWYSGKPVSALGSEGWSGSSSGWITARHLLPAALTGQDNVQFRLKFMADKFNNQYDGIAMDDIRIYDSPYDLGVFEIIAPISACELPADQKFSLRLKNYGFKSLQAGDSVKIGYHIDRSGDIRTGEETIYLTQAFPSGETRDYIMETGFDFSVPGEYHVNVFTIEQDPSYYQSPSNDTLYRLIRVNKPVVDLGPDISTVRPDTVTLKAYSGVAGNNYLWQDNSVDSIFHVITQGTYYVRVTNTIGCVASDTIRVTKLIADAGIKQVVSPVSACELGTQVPVIISLQNYGTDTVAVGDTIFIFRDINSVVLADTLVFSENLVPGNAADFTFSQGYDFSVQGTYNMKLYTRYRDDSDKLNDTLLYTLENYGYPAIDLGNDTTLTAAQYVLTAAPGYHSYLWQDGSTLNSYTVDMPGQALYHVTVNDDHLCETRDSVRVTLNMTDLELVKILSPETSCGLSEIITVSVRIRNSGTQTLSSGQKVRLGFLVNGASPKQDSVLLSSNFLPGDSLDFVFSQKASVVTGNWYDFTVFLRNSIDMKPANDTIIMPVGVFASPVVNLGQDYRVITGIEYTLDAGAGFASYLWQDGSTGQTFTITTPGINTCSVTVTDAIGCTGYDEVQLMLAVPDIGVIEVVSPVTSCSLGTGEHIQLAIKNLGNWSIDKTANISVSYSINGMPAVSENVILNSTFVNNSVIYHTFAASENLSAPGHYEIIAATVYGSDLIPSNDTLSSALDVMGIPVTDIGGGQDTILTYNPVTLSATAGYASYKWQDGSSNNDFNITVPGSGMYSVTVTASNGCISKDSVYVVYDKPDIGITHLVGPVTSCKLDQNTPVSFEIINNGYYRIPDAQPLAISYRVNGGSPIEETIYLSGVLKPGYSRIVTFTDGYDFSGTGDYQINVTLGYMPDQNVSNNTAVSSISVLGIPVVDIGDGMDTLKTSLPITLDAGAGFSSYLWQDNSVNSTIVATQWNLFRVVVTDNNGCTGTDSVYVLSPHAINDVRVFPGSVRIYPNPAHDILHLSVELEQPGEVIVEIFNVLNKQIYREDLDEIRVVEKDIIVQGLPAGIYFVRIMAGDIPNTSVIVVN